MGSPRHLVFRILLLALGCGIAYLLGEAVLAMRGPRTEAAPQARPQAASSAYHSSPWYYPFATRTVDMQAVVEAFSWEPSTRARANSHGFRTPEYTIAHPPATLRVVVIGDSITWGQGVRLEETFSAVAQGLLENGLADRGIRAEVIAVGVCGSRFSDNYIRLRAHVAQLEPDVVIFQYFPNDLEHLMSYRRPELLRSLEAHSNLLQAVRAVVERNRFWELVHAHVDPTSLEWRLFVDVLGEIDRWRHTTATPVLVLGFPPFDQRRDGGNFDGWRELEAHDHLLRRPFDEMKRLDLPVVDILEVFRTAAGRRFLCVSAEDGHPNAFAHSLVGQALVNALAAHELLPDEPGRLAAAGDSWEVEHRLRNEAHEHWAELNLDYGAQRPLLDALLELRPDNGWLVSQVAHLSQQVGDRGRACALYRSLLEIEPETALPWYHIALCSDDPRQRRSALERMLEIDPDHAPSVEELMMLASADGRLEDACVTAVELGRLARYPEQFARAHEFFANHGCADRGLDFWG